MPKHDIKQLLKALTTIEGLTFYEDVKMDEHKRLELIYTIAHSALRHCDNPHEDWQQDTDNAYKSVTEMGLAFTVEELEEGRLNRVKIK